MKFYTYLWLREDGTPYYVGKGSGKRAFDGRRKGIPKDRSRIKVQYWIDEETAFAYERYLIDFYGRKDLGTGCLCNLSDGGDGLKNPSAETRRKLTELHKNPSEETRRRMSAAWTEERRTAVRARQCGTKLSLEHRRKLSESHLGKKLSAEQCAKIGLAHLGTKHKKYSLEARLRVSASLLGRKLSDAHRKNIGEAVRRRWASGEAFRGVQKRTISQGKE